MSKLTKNPSLSNSRGDISVPSISTQKKKESQKEKLDEINKQLAEVRKKLAERNPSKAQRKNSKSPVKKREFHHPKLEFILGQIVHSPYMTKPLDKYPQETFDIPHKLHELKRKACKVSDLPKEEHPFDLDEVKDRFMKEIVNFTVTYKVASVSYFLFFQFKNFYDWFFFCTKYRKLQNPR
jgi:hypothetical protein